MTLKSLVSSSIGSQNTHVVFVRQAVQLFQSEVNKQTYCMRYFKISKKLYSHVYPDSLLCYLDRGLAAFLLFIYMKN